MVVMPDANKEQTLNALSAQRLVQQGNVVVCCSHGWRQQTVDSRASRKAKTLK